MNLKSIRGSIRGITALALTAGLASLPYIAAAQPVSTYQFSSTTGTYTPITGGTVINTSIPDSWQSNAITLTPGFNFCGTVYTTAFMTSNGLISLGGTTGPGTGQYNGIANNGSGSGINLCPFNSDMVASTATGVAPEMRYELVGDEHVFQWQDISRWATTATERFSFQARLNTVTGVIRYVYTVTAVGTATNYQPVIGIRTASTTGNWQSRKVTATETWATSLNAPTSASDLRFTSATPDPKQPANGQIYQYKPLPPIDMGVDSIIYPAAFCSNSTQPVSVRIRNYGTDDINTVTVHWQVDGVAKAPVTYSATVLNMMAAPGNMAIVSLGNVFFPDATAKTIKAWTAQPNNVADEDNSNDTLSAHVAASLQGIDFTITPGDTVICSDQNVTFDAGTYPLNPFYVWNTGALSQTVTVNQAGLYWVKVQNTLGCFDIDTVQVTYHPDPLVNSIAIIDNGSGSFTFNLIGAQYVTSYNWDFGDGSTTTGPGPKTHSYTTPGEYTVTVTLTNDCGQITTTRVVATGSTGINDLTALQKEIKVFPNPSKGLVTIANNSGIKMKAIALFNIMGQKVYSAAQQNAEKYTLDVSGFAAGIYNVIIDTDKGIISKKLDVKQ